MAVNPFRQLLNHISHELTRHNLRSLLCICAPYVPEYRREDIHCGLDLFECLIHWNIIGEDLDKMQNLLELMRKMRPKRKDIVRTVKQYIRENYEPPWGIEESMETCCSNYEGVVCNQPYVTTCVGSKHAINDTSSRASTPLLGGSGDNQYSWCCICFDCKCVPRPVPNCILIFAIIVCLIMTIFVSIVWFGKIPSWNKRLGDMNSPVIGGSIVGVLALLCVCLMGWFIKRMLSPSQNRLPLSSYCSSVEFPNSSMTSGSMMSVPYVTNKRYKKRRRSPTSTVPVGSVTTVDSCATSHHIPTRVSTPPTPHSYPDGFHDNMLTEEEGTSGDYAASGEESEGPVTVVHMIN